MSFDSFSEFIAMGGHGFYVWLSYAIALVLIIVNLVSPVMRKKKLITELIRRFRRESRNP